MRRAPSSTAFWMMDSMIFPLGTACSRVREQGGGGVKFFSDTDSVTASRELFSTAQRNSFPTPSKTATSSPRFRRKTRSA